VVAVRYTERGKSVKQFRGAGPTNRTYELLAMGRKEPPIETFME
jgi:hypothetical protein